LSARRFARCRPVQCQGVHPCSKGAEPSGFAGRDRRSVRLVGRGPRRLGWRRNGGQGVDWLVLARGQRVVGGVDGESSRNQGRQYCNPHEDTLSGGVQRPVPP